MPSAVASFSPWRLRLWPLAGVVFLALTACARHSEDELRARLKNWFSLGDTLYFQSQMGCTAALFAAQSDGVKAALPLGNQAETAVFDLRQRGVIGLMKADRSPDQWFIDVMNADRPTGVAVQAAAIRAKACMSEDMRAQFQKALRQKGAVFVYDDKLKILALFDPESRRVLVSGGNR